MVHLEDDVLIQRLTIRAVELEQEFDALKRMALNRMGELNDTHNNALLDELIEIAKAIINLPDIEGLDLCEDLYKKYWKIKEQILQIMDHSYCESTISLLAFPIAPASQS